jgi:pyruvate/2-oxoglutarate dehydrogenase complex dihydrolipoamide dehydrogenase (E3) component
MPPRRRGDVRPAGQIRQSQIVTTFGPGAMVDLPDHAVIVGGSIIGVDTTIVQLRKTGWPPK